MLLERWGAASSEDCSALAKRIERLEHMDIHGVAGEMLIIRLPADMADEDVAAFQEMLKARDVDAIILLANNMDIISLGRGDTT